MDYFKFNYKGKKSQRNLTKLVIWCEIHGRFECEMVSFLSGTRCRKCRFDSFRLKLEDVILMTKDITLGEFSFIDTKYTKAKDKFLFIHNKCGTEFKSSWDNFKSGDVGCPRCSKGKSKGESYFKSFLVQNNINFIPEYRIEGCKDKLTLPFDFAIMDNYGNIKMLIEIDSSIHYKYTPYIHKTYENFLDKQNKDKLKEEYCDKNGIKLYKPYYNKVEDIKKWINTNKGMILESIKKRG